MLRHRILCAFLWFWASQSLALGPTRYHTTDEINAVMRRLASDNPELVRLRHLGYSPQGRDLSYVIVSKGDPDNQPAMYMNGAHHGNERSSSEAVVALASYLVRRAQDPLVDELLSRYAIYLQPVVNADGHALGTRADSEGNDPNRDYSLSMDQSTKEGGFRLSFIRLVKELTDKVRFRAAIAFHSGMEAVLWPWCTTDQRSPQTDLFFTLAKAAAGAMNIKRYMQSYFDYPTRGEFIDYVYAQHGTLALTFEVSEHPEPDVKLLPKVTERAVAGAMTFMLKVLDWEDGQLALETGAPQRGGERAYVLPNTASR